jgi:hypothetical protein
LGGFDIKADSMKGTVVILFTALAILFSGCESTVAKKQATLSKAVYAENAAMKAGRFDLAQAYGAQAARLIAPPKSQVAVKSVAPQGKEVVILPEEDADLPDVAVDSTGFNTLVSQDKGLQDQLNAENGTLAKVEKAADQVITAEAKDAAKQEARPSLWSGIWKKLTLFGVPVLLIGGAVVLCLFFPALLPLFVSLAKVLFSICNSVIGLIGSAITSVLSWIKPKS